MPEKYDSKISKKHILVVDDDPDVVEMLHYTLVKQGYKIEVANNGLEALKRLNNKLPDLIILDLMMPVFDGIQTAKTIQNDANAKHIPILVLTAKTSEHDEISAIEAGADDFIRKPVSSKLLVSRIEAMFRRKDKNLVSEPFPETIKINDVVINETFHTVFFKNEEILLTPKEFDLLVLLAKNPGRVFTRQDLLDRIWGKDIVVIERTIDVHVRRLREKINEDLIETMKGVGYRIKK